MTAHHVEQAIGAGMLTLVAIGLLVTFLWAVGGAYLEERKLRADEYLQSCRDCSLHSPSPRVVRGQENHR